MDKVGIDQSKVSTSSNGKQATIKFKKHPDKSSSPDYQAVAVKEIKENPKVSLHPKKCATNKGDLEVQQCHSRKSSTTTGDSITPREQYVSTSSLPAFDV